MRQAILGHKDLQKMVSSFVNVKLDIEFQKGIYD